MYVKFKSPVNTSTSLAGISRSLSKVSKYSFILFTVLFHLNATAFLAVASETYEILNVEGTWPVG